MTDLVTRLKQMLAAHAMAERTVANVMKIAGLKAERRYYPEAHYMRGPGPKWRAKHGVPERRLALVVTSRGLHQR